MTNILSVGKSALNAAQVGISVTGHNIANANTEGYSRQTISQQTKPAQNFGYGYVGQGTDVTTIERVFNETLAKQMNNSYSVYEGVDTHKSNLDQINTMLADSEAGLNPAMNDFFASIQNLSANASDIPSRQVMLSSSNALANRLNSMGDRLNSLQQDVSNQITGYVSSINGIASQIQSLNVTIQDSLGATGTPPNDLMDQRDNLVTELSKMIKTSVLDDGAGGYNVFVGKGLPLVIGKDQYQMVATQNPTDPTRMEVGYSSKGKVTILGEQSLDGGKLGGLISFREESLDLTQNRLGQIGLVLAQKMNDLQAGGFDLNGDAGTDLFSVPEPTVTGHTDNTGTAIVSSTIADPDAVTSSDYRIKYDGTNYNIIRSDDNNIQSFGSLPQTVDGVTFQIDSGTMLAGDEFKIMPTHGVAEEFKVVIDDPNMLAMAGSATGGPSDNENGLLMAKLQLEAVVQGPNDAVNKTTFSSAFAQLTSLIGNQANELSVIGTAESSALDAAIKNMQSESGVNLDEEAANLIQYQQAYQAAGKMMQMASELFNVILQLGA